MFYSLYVKKIQQTRHLYNLDGVDLLKYVVPYDLGTGGLKAGLYQFDGTSAGFEFVPYQTFFPEADCVNCLNLKRSADGGLHHFGCGDLAAKFLRKINTFRNEHGIQRNLGGGDERYATLGGGNKMLAW
ncbi:MAG: hypothetical protein ACD_34C00543G0001, partial [uncultured bacterium]